MAKFYATFAETQTEIAIFETEAERDEWVDYKDPFSLSVGETPEDTLFERIALTEKSAGVYSKGRIYNPKYYINDENLNYVTWVVAPNFKLNHWRYNK